ncbi:MAG: helix-turn-helix domain-containing protein [Butyricicoccaceae bacterium]
MSEFDAVERIHALCQARSWSYYKLAQKSGIPYSTLNTMLRKTNAPSLPSLSKICDGFGITLAQFFFGAGACTELE